MTDAQLEKIKEFAKSFYQKADQFHDVRHAQLTIDYAFLLAKDFPQTNTNILEAACWLHDIGRVNIDEGHPQESARLAQPFLEQLDLSPEETRAILHAIVVHGVEEIHNAKTIEAKLLFDADKIQQLSVYGFIRMTMYMVAVQKMDMAEAITKRWAKVQHIFNGYMQTPHAKAIVTPEMEKIRQLVEDFKNGSSAKL